LLLLEGRILYQYISRKEARRVIASDVGTDDKSELNSIIEKVREHIFSMYTRLDIVPKIQVCLATKTYWQDCNLCEDTYTGITLPEYAESVEAVWVHTAGLEIETKTRYYEWSPQIDETFRGLNKSSISPMIGHFPTIVDMPQSGHVTFMAESAVDDGCGDISVTYLNDCMIEVREAIPLTTGGMSTSQPVSSFKQGGIVLPDRHGDITAFDEEGLELSRYPCYVNHPTYRRYNVRGLCGTCTNINVVVGARYYPLVDDYDPVEVGNRTAFSMLAKYYSILSDGKMDANDRTNAETYRIKAEEMLFGDKDRQGGRISNTRLHVNKTRNPYSRTRMARRRTR